METTIMKTTFRNDIKQWIKAGGENPSAVLVSAKRVRDLGYGGGEAAFVINAEGSQIYRDLWYFEFGPKRYDDLVALCATHGYYPELGYGYVTFYKS